MWSYGLVCLCPFSATGEPVGPVALPWATYNSDAASPVSGPQYSDADTSGDSIKSMAAHSPVSPSGAMYRSLLVPGLGQYANGKRFKALLFFSAEAFFAGGYVYMRHEVNRDDITEFQRDLYRTDRNSYVIYWMLAKVFGMVDAYVDAQLAGFNVDDITPPEIERDSSDTTPEPSVETDRKKSPEK